MRTSINSSGYVHSMYPESTESEIKKEAVMVDESEYEIRIQEENNISNFKTQEDERN